MVGQSEQYLTFFVGTLKVKRAWIDALQVFKDHRCQSRLSYPAKLSVITEAERKSLNGEADLRNFDHQARFTDLSSGLLDRPLQSKEVKHKLRVIRNE